MYLVIIIIFNFLHANLLEDKYQNLSVSASNGKESNLIAYNPVLENENVYLEHTVDPDQYSVGPGDVFLFNMISTDGMHTLNLEVSPLGTVLIPNVGDIFVDKMILSQAFQKIKSTCLKSYANAKVNLTLSKIKKYKVQVVGSVISPGFVLVNPFMRISDIYSLVNNVSNLDSQIDHFNSNNDISLRNIILKRDNEEYRVDLFKYFYQGDKNSNPFTKQGDIIYFKNKKNEVTIKGGIEFPGTYEFVANESIYTLINLAGSFTYDADINYVEISRFKDDTNKEKYVIKTIDEMNTFKLEPYDYVHVRYKKEFKRRELISIDGEIKYPGEYDFNQDMTIGDLLEISGGYTDEADINRIIINNEKIINNIDNEYERILLIPSNDRTASEISYIKARNKIKRGLIVSEDFNRTQEILSYFLQPGDLIYIPKKSNYIEILGSVHFPGRYPYYQSFSVNDYIASAGGKTNNATNKIYIIDNASNQRNRIRGKSTLENGDILFIQSAEDYSPYNRFKEVMFILGQAASLYAVIMINNN
tara:strand:+ start:1163 stop:2758 length:1596 start_codon:yes stop_codon:yes gene_type:complete